MAPADQRFGAHQPAIAELNLQLEEQLEFVPFGGVCRVRSPASKTRLELLADRTFKRDCNRPRLMALAR